MSRSSLSLVLGAILVLGAALPASAQTLHVDKKNGFQVVPPKGWTKVPIKVEERWIAAKWLSDKKYDDKESGFSHQPMMKVMIFDRSKIQPGGGSTDSAGGAKEQEGPKVGDKIDLTAPYLDYKDYLKRNFNEGGWFVSAEDATKMGSTPVTMIEVKVEKLTYTGKKRLLAWVFTADWGDLAIEVDSLEQSFDKLRPIILGAYKTFKLIPRDPTLAGEDPGIDVGGGIRFVDPNETAEQRKKRRQAAEEAMFKKAVSDLPSEWSSKRSANFLVLNHANPKFQEKVLAHAEAVRAWLDANFGDVGDDYVQKMIIRICKNRDEEMAFRKGSGDAFSIDSREAIVSENKDGTSQFEFEYLGQSIMRMWFHDKNADLYDAMPQWLERGLSQYIGTAVLKGGRLDFSPDTYETERIREGRRMSKFSPVRDLFQMTGKDLWSGENARYLDAQIASVFRYVYGPGRANRKLSTLIKDYITQLLAVVQENEKAARAEVKAEGAKTEEEEEEEFKKRRKQDWSAKEKEFLKQVSEKVFGGWTDGDWAGLQKGWEAFAK
ncbi:MAG: hypothetical protein HUU15_07035 [Candidatus Brocadiae bacterium]|nr:hypothetical protein [Candidatus Brocadiia bacterium]